MSVIDTLADLVRLDSINPEWQGPGEAAVAAYVRDFFDRAGIECQLVEVLPGRPNVIARLPGTDPTRRVVLEAHMDTVSVADMTIPPFEPAIRDGRLYGRGSCDVKAGLAAMMHALRDLHEAGETPACEVILGAVIDEEHAYRGVLGLLDSLAAGPLPEAAIVAEPTEMRLIRANKGVLRYRIATRGRSAHSSKPHLGVNAIVGMTAVIEALVADDARLATLVHPLVGRATSSIGLIEGGAQVNFVPENCRITLDRRLLPGESAEVVRAACDRMLDGVRAAHPDLTIVVEPPYLTDEAMETPADAPVVTVASRVLAGMGLDPEPAGVPFGCDCSKLSRAGIPSVIFGPGSIDRAHGAVEYVEIDQVHQARDFYRHFLATYG